MNKIVILIVTAIMCFLSCKSNYTRIGDKNANYIPYYLKVYEADSLFLIKNYQRSYEILDSLFNKYEPINMEGYYEYGNYLYSSVMIGNKKKFRKKVKYSYKEFGNILIYGNDFIQKRTKINEIAKIKQSKIDIYKQCFFKKINLDLRKKIENIILEDQSVRGKDNNHEGQIFYQKKHSREIDSIFKKNGFPSFKSLGTDNFFENTAELSIVLVHQGNNLKNYLPFILQNVKNGKCSPNVYSLLYDRMIWNENFDLNGSFKQYYGSYTDSRGLPALPLVNEKKIDSIRKNIGLPQLKYYQWKVSQYSSNLK